VRRELGSPEPTGVPAGAGSGAPADVPVGAGSGAPAGPSPKGGTPWAILRLAVAVALIVAVLLAAGLGPLLLFIVALVVVVVLHELGHYLTAKWSHMKVTEFFIGFGPRLWSVRRGETDYGVKPILVGAYVKIPGMTNLEQLDPADEARTYRQQPFRRRVLVASAGSIMHYVIALILGIVLAIVIGIPTGAQVEVTGFTRWAGHPETAAQVAGMKAGDRILSVDRKSVTTTTQLSQAIQAAKGHAVRLVVERDGRRSGLTVQPQAGHAVTSGSTAGSEVLGNGTGKQAGKTEWLIGVQVSVAPVFTGQSPWQAAAWAGRDVGDITRLTVIGLGHVFSPGGLSSLFHQVTSTQTADKAAANPAQSNRILSLVGVGRLATQAEERGAYYFISVLIALNIALGLLNMLPMLPLDGGHVAIAVYERIRTRRGRPYYRADVSKLLPVAYAFMAVLLVIVGSALFLDIAHPLANPFG
jgi:membrane-associated protease RseP (regulator of RpoE activity)